MSEEASTLRDVIIFYKDMIPTFFFDLLLQWIPKELLGYDIKRLLRMLVIVAGYLLVRKLLLRNQVIKAQKSQFEAPEGEEGAASENVENLFNKEGAGADAKSSAIQEAGWGWGQKTRRDIKAKQQFLQRLKREKDESDDEDIQDLLED